MAGDFNKKKGKMVFAKDKKQAVLAIFVMVFFVIYATKAAIDVYKINHPPEVNVTALKETSETTENSENALSTEQEIPINEQNLSQNADDIYSQTMALKGESPQNNHIKIATPTISAVEEIDIITKKKSRGKMVTVDVSNSGRTNPFMPAIENVPKYSLTYLTPPPETLQETSNASKIMTTTISGIMYDKYSPSAIINIEGNDYLVKKGDVINNYKVLSINKTQVLVQLGRNIYKAGVGELLSKTDLNCNTIANLDKKFGGNSIPINVKKRSY